MKKLFTLIFALFTIGTGFSNAQNPWNGKVVLQGFWWDYYNNNYPAGWNNYLSDLAPRLKDIGIDGIWIPPAIKNAGTNSNGYGPFDHYDLGDKYQKGSTKTRAGNKDELLRMTAVMHANGIDVIHDIVLNHLSDAGSRTGAGGQDFNSLSSATNSGYKNFRYVSFTKPASSETSANYLARNGRWPKNYQNFYPNPGNNFYNTGDWDAVLFGPDVSFESSAFGQSTNATYNPIQVSNHMRNGARDWLIWYKKQTGADGFRFDAAKNYPFYALQDVLFNAKYNASWANGGANLYAVGEYVGGGNELDTWINNVKTSNGGSEDMVGTFDFGLRSELKNVTSSNGSYDLGTLPGKQQNNRYRTVPFVNNHDTFRPQVDASGNYIGWNSGNELGGGHIEPFDARLALCYAVAFAVDGSPQVFFEDLFNVGNTGKRFTHTPKSLVDLPVRDDIANIIWCHQKLNFKKGFYKVRSQNPDLLIVERGYNVGPENSYAIIGVNDSYNTWQNANIQTDFGPNVQLHDYSGANSNDIYTDGNGRVTIFVPPCDGSNIRKGYTIWGKAGVSGGFAPAQRSTTQEWEMADDLGDNATLSLKQGGSLPANSITERIVGKVFSESGKLITVNVYPVNASSNTTVRIYNSSNASVATIAGVGNTTLTYNAPSTGYYTIKLRHTTATFPKQNAYVKVNYTAPSLANTTVSVAAAIPNDLNVNSSALVNYPDPFSDQTTISFTLAKRSFTTLAVYSLDGKLVKIIEQKQQEVGTHEIEFESSQLPQGIYVVKLNTEDFVRTHKMVLAR